VAPPEEGVTEGTANALQNPRPFHSPLFGGRSPSPAPFAAGEERKAG